MRTKSETSPESIVREIKRKTRRKFGPEEKIRIIPEGLRGEESIADLCRTSQMIDFYKEVRQPAMKRIGRNF